MENIAIENQGLIDTIPNLSERASMLVVSNNGLITSVDTYFTSRLKNLSELFTVNKDRVDEIEVKDFNKHTKRLLDQKKDIKEIQEKLKFSTVAKMKVPVMVGLNKTIPEAIMILQPAIEIVQKQLAKRVNECDDYVAKMLADKDFKKSLKPFKIDNNFIKEVHTVRSALRELMDADAVIDRDTIDSLLPNLSSLDNIVSNLAVLGNHNTTKNLNDIQKVTKMTSGRVDALYIEFTENTEVAINEDKIHVLARYLELTGEFVTTSISLLRIVTGLTNLTTNVINRLKGNI